MSNADLIRAFYKSLTSADTKSAAKYLDPKLQLHVPTHKNAVEDLLTFFAAVRASFPDVAYTVDVTVEQASLVAESVTMTGTLTGSPFQGLPADGSKVTLRSVTISRVENGLISERWETTTGWP